MLKKGCISVGCNDSGMPVYAASLTAPTSAFLNIPIQQHIQGAVNIPLKEMKARIAAGVPDKNDTAKLYCNSGRQSG